MKNQIFTCGIFFCFVFIYTEPLQSVEIAHFGKRIQPDGFLVEWSAKTVHNWDNEGLWYWDAINTPEGVSGYIRSEKAVGCSSWTFIVEPSGRGKPIEMKVPLEESNDKNLYTMDTELYKESQMVVFEWVVPWNRADLDAGKQYALDIRGRSSCGDILPPLMINGSKDPPTRLITPKIIFQGVFIVILLALYIIIRIKIRNQTRRKRSLRREA